ncbi:dihydrodipicolinate synthase family protein [Nonomuraea jiangxiensis]|uniref:Dihydrodipicolinate synthase/N-acetylneuraminate lyase n=1 Tax=Nonomuraea jiangxiensis TaxID=633440 RepID=A0A1G9VPE5_9ACTN|nr:dihydrodipicolinate synthase family protein [Nonomuraea jiangxiensis]SDM74092.1 Dihydrodipicolinate synthase/N-acetylneuraminate lyase [Nonomuraea jiangxiensis]
METLTAGALGGTWGTVLLPIRNDESIDWARLEAALDVLVAVGLDGLYAHGTAGEFHTLGEDEYDRVNALLAEQCERHQLPFQIGAGHMSAQTCLARVARARELRPGAIQVTLPDWLPVSRGEVVRFLARVAAAADPVPLVLYNPPHAKTQVPADLYPVIRREVPAVIGIKVAGGDARWYAEMERHAAGLAVFVAGHDLATGRRYGAAGSYSNIAALNPAGAMAWQRMMVAQPEAALDVEQRIREFFAAHVQPLQRSGYASAALDKFLAHLGDWADIGTRVRWPYDSVDASLAVRLRPLVRAQLPELFPGA